MRSKLAWSLAAGVGLASVAAGGVIFGQLIQKRRARVKAAQDCLKPPSILGFDLDHTLCRLWANR